MFALTAPITTNTLVPDDNCAFSGGTIGQAMHTSTSGRTQVSSMITARTLVLAAFGQSMAINQGPTAYTPLNTAAHALNPYNSLIYQAKDPEIGTWTLGGVDGGNYLTMVADELITRDVFDRVILMPNNVGSSEVLDWSPAGTLNQRVRIAALQMMSRGWHRNPLVDIACIWDQGHDDNGTSLDDYIARFLTVQNTMIGLGLDVPWFICCNSYSGGSINATITAAGAALVNSNANRFQGADTDSITDRQVDTIHLDDDGLAANAALWTDILEAHFSP